MRQEKWRASTSYQLGSERHVNSCVCELVKNFFQPILEGLLGYGTLGGNNVKEFLQNDSCLFAGLQKNCMRLSSLEQQGSSLFHLP